MRFSIISLFLSLGPKRMRITIYVLAYVIWVHMRIWMTEGMCPSVHWLKYASVNIVRCQSVIQLFDLQWLAS